MNRYILLIPAVSLLSACGQLIYPNEDVGPAYAQNSSIKNESGSKSRAPLDVPPELRAELEMPMNGEVASRADEEMLSRDYQEAVAGKAVALDAKVYSIDAAKVFSAVVDAMTSLNVPVQSVDSPSGIVTSDWIREGSNTAGMIDVFGLTTGDLPTRHRFIVRVYRVKIEGEAEVSKLEVRVHGQEAVGRRWVNKPFKRKASEQLFIAVEEQLQRMQYGITGEKTGDIKPEEITAPEAGK